MLVFDITFNSVKQFYIGNNNSIKIKKNCCAIDKIEEYLNKNKARLGTNIILKLKTDLRGLNKNFSKDYYPQVIKDIEDYKYDKVKMEKEIEV